MWRMIVTVTFSVAVLVNFLDESLAIVFKAQVDVYEKTYLHRYEGWNAYGRRNNSLQRRSRLDCFVKCQTMLSNNCISFTFDSYYKHCFIYSKLLKGDVILNYYPAGFQIPRSCPAGFSYVIVSDTCWKLLVGSWTWNQSRQQCNQLHPLSHPVFFDETKSIWNLMYFLPSYLDKSFSKCLVGGMYANLWTAGYSPYLNPNRTQFIWKPFQNYSRPVTGTKWGNINITDTSAIYCLVLINSKGIFEEKCLSLRCVLCEVQLDFNGNYVLD